uniref:Uncharacterized protein n=1 Tax=Rhizophora mucronata TaxID=61149 RepID=A0A2P2LWB8_RHIMU
MAKMQPNLVTQNKLFYKFPHNSEPISLLPFPPRLPNIDNHNFYGKENKQPLFQLAPK